MSVNRALLSGSSVPVRTTVPAMLATWLLSSVELAGDDCCCAETWNARRLKRAPPVSETTILRSTEFIASRQSLSYFIRGESSVARLPPLQRPATRPLRLGTGRTIHDERLS